MSEALRVSIIGDGQLGRMLTQAAIPMGMEVNVVGEADPSPAAQVGAFQIEGSIKNANAIYTAVDMADVTTIEVEHVLTGPLVRRAAEGHSVQPSPKTIATIQNKFLQKRHLERRGIPVAPYDYLMDAKDLQAAREHHGQDLIAKAATGAYDGRGNLVLTPSMTWDDIKHSFEDKHGNRSHLYVEKIVPFQRELAVVIARSTKGEVAAYPVVQTVHQKSICHEVYAPADIDPRVVAAAEELGRETLRVFDGAGVFAVEMFQDENDNVLVNEVAPRVHNSGHFSIIGSQTSQFEQHLRAITGMPLGDTSMRFPSAVMVNILGTSEVQRPVPAEALAVEAGPNAEINWYGKETRDARKIGHITVAGSSFEDNLARARALRAQMDV